MSDSDTYGAHVPSNGWWKWNHSSIRIPPDTELHRILQEKMKRATEAVNRDLESYCFAHVERCREPV